MIWSLTSQVGSISAQEYDRWVRFHFDVVDQVVGPFLAGVLITVIIITLAAIYTKIHNYHSKVSELEIEYKRHIREQQEKLEELYKELHELENEDNQ